MAWKGQMPKSRCPYRELRNEPSVTGGYGRVVENVRPMLGDANTELIMLSRTTAPSESGQTRQRHRFAKDGMGQRYLGNWINSASAPTVI